MLSLVIRPFQNKQTWVSCSAQVGVGRIRRNCKCKTVKLKVEILQFRFRNSPSIANDISWSPLQHRGNMIRTKSALDAAFPTGSLPEWKAFLLGLTASGVRNRMDVPAANDVGPVRRFIDLVHNSEEDEIVTLFPAFLSTIRRKLPELYHEAFVLCCYLLNVIPTVKGVRVISEFAENADELHRNDV